MATEAQAESLGTDFFKEILHSNRDTVHAAVRDAMLDGIKKQFQWELPEAVKREVQAFIAEDILPEIRAELVASKDVFVNAATEMARAAPVEIAKAMQEHIAKNLTNSWTLRKVVEAMFA
jgi:FKBP-type peptidyl-prolyl cis-trans isomerase (trigger factor)